MAEIRLGFLEFHLGGLAPLALAGGNGFQVELSENKVAVVITTRALLRQLVVGKQFQPNASDAAQLGISVNGVDRPLKLATGKHNATIAFLQLRAVSRLQLSQLNGCPLCGLGGGSLPHGQALYQVVVVFLERCLSLGDAFLLLAVRISLARGYLHLVSLKLGLCQVNGLLTRLGTLHFARLNFLLKLGQLIERNFMLGLDVCDRPLGCLDFTWGGVTVDHAQEQLVDHFLIVSLCCNELGNGVVAGNNSIVHCWTAD